eukprot:g14739.t1
MAKSEEEQPLVEDPAAAGGAGSPTKPSKRRTKGPTLRGLVATAFVAMGVFIVAALASRTIMWEDPSLVEDTVYESGGDSTNASLKAVSGLIDPNNGTHPTLTTTQDCTGDYSLPVLTGVDVVAYWSLPAGAEPVLGKPDLTSQYGNYRFYFSSIENLQTFESNPDKYVPAFGGFCSYGVAAEPVWTADTLGPFGDPSKWVILSDGRLHIFRSRFPMIKFSVAPAEFLKAGKANWDSWFPPDEGLAPMNTACFCSEEILLVIVAAAVSLLPAWVLDRPPEGTEVSLSDESPVVDTAAGVGAAAATDVYVPLTGLIDPHNGDNGTDPAQTTTDECARQYDLPVLKGVDLVAYWTLPDGAEPVMGTANLIAFYGAYRFYFSSIANLRAFEADPLKYLPAYGGFCSYGIANEPVWTDTTLGPFGNPSKWKISRDDRLHIFRSSVPMLEFAEDVPGNIQRGHAVWNNWFGDTGGPGPLNVACFCTEASCDDQGVAGRSSERETGLSERVVTGVLLMDEEDGTTLAPVHVTTPECTGDTSKAVAHGADVVAYWSLEPGHHAVFGSEEFSALYGRYLFYFSSLENKLEFESNPERYLPAFGGFCSYGVSHEPIWNEANLGPPSNPDFWLIYEGRLYLFRSATPFGKFQTSVTENVTHGWTVWHEWFGDDADASTTPFNTACFCSENTCSDG